MKNTQKKFFTLHNTHTHTPMWNLYISSVFFLVQNFFVFFFALSEYLPGTKSKINVHLIVLQMQLSKKHSNDHICTHQINTGNFMNFNRFMLMTVMADSQILRISEIAKGNKNQLDSLDEYADENGQTKKWKPNRRICIPFYLASGDLNLYRYTVLT